MSIDNDIFNQYREDQLVIEKAKGVLNEYGYVIYPMELSDKLKDIIESVSSGKRPAEGGIKEIESILKDLK